jgi:hypothetical protein
MREKDECKRKGHAWTDWELVWDEKWGRVWQRYCLRCPKTEESIVTPSIEIRRSILRRRVPVK